MKQTHDQTAFDLLKSHYQRLAKESFVHALFSALIVGFSAMFLAATALWFFGQLKLLWISIVVGVAMTGGMLPLFYFKKYRPSAKVLARRVDELGLEERLITMHQLKDDTSYMAEKQREDTLSALSALNAAGTAKVKIALSLPLLLAAVFVGAASITSVPVYAFATGEKGGLEHLESTLAEPIPEYEIVYEVQGDGEIVGEAIQFVLEGGDATQVEAVPFENWAFSHWLVDGVEILPVDEAEGAEDSSEMDAEAKAKAEAEAEERELEASKSKSPIRLDENVKRNVVYTAVFEEVPEGEDDEEEDGEDGEPGEPSENPTESEPKEGEESPSSPQSPGGGSSNNDSHMIIDGETDFSSQIDGAQSDANSDMADGGVSGEVGDVVGGYYGSIGG